MYGLNKHKVCSALKYPIVSLIDLLSKLYDCPICGKRFINTTGKIICSDECKKEYYLQIRKSKKERTTRVCKGCSEEFITEYGDQRRDYCSKECNNKAYKNTEAYKRHKKLHKGGVSKAKRQRIFERDNYTCQICMKKVRMDVIGTVGTGRPHPLAPTIDHIIPRSECKELGWTKAEMNKESNLNTAHFMCNVMKSNKAIGQQLRLC
jgi:5-methylcytosine-specific restriction endonuclease McrA